ncbi:uncharacterized protein [Asterias amurensis]|uniref:uncharacterized protein isoform X1 n=1 Tax=Asterias amurensis TaxID=7602 RepID=UPI003AB2C407
MGSNVCAIICLVAALVSVVCCTSEHPQAICGPRCQSQMIVMTSDERPRKKCDSVCKLRSLVSHAGKRKKSSDLSQDAYLWNQQGPNPTFTADVNTEGQRATCRLEEAMRNLSPKWQERLLSVLNGAFRELNGEQVDDTSFDL